MENMKVRNLNFVKMIIILLRIHPEIILKSLLSNVTFSTFIFTEFDYVSTLFIDV